MLCRCPGCEGCVDLWFGERWMKFRSKVLYMVDNPYFEWFILVLIFASSITLCFEDIYLDNNLTLKKVLYWTNFVFCIIFTAEMVLKWIALGFYKYFGSFWTVLDFVIAFVSPLFIAARRIRDKDRAGDRFKSPESMVNGTVTYSGIRVCGRCRCSVC